MVAQEINNLLYRGDGYARMMQGDFTEKNINNAINTGIDDHSAMVIENNTKQIIKSSRKIDNEMLKHISELQNNDRNVSESLDFHWVGDKYAATSSPIFEKNKKIGTIYMFLDRSYIQQLIFNFSKVFILIVLLSLLITILLLVYLSKVITSPLIKIKEGAEKITQGNYSLSLDINTNDELQDLAHSIEELSTKLNLVEKERNEFLASIAHELRTPLTFIRGYADILKRPTITSFDKLEYITIIQEETDRLTQLLENLMMLAQLEEHEFKINKIEVNLKPFIENVKKNPRHFFLKKIYRWN
ncbi:HAMP domain-containing protein [Lactococcus lactis]|nr:HAMP domain-containing protein [Lactococcus lactis]